MKKLLFIFFLSHSILWSQQETSSITKKTFSSREGYLISEPYSSSYDSNGWFWVLGEDLRSNEYVFGEKKVIIQRFDGIHFFSVKMPETGDKRIKEGSLFKYKKEGFYLRLLYSNYPNAELFYIDTATLEITNVTEFNSLPKKYTLAAQYYVKDATRILVTSSDKLYSGELNGLKFNLLDSIPFNKKLTSPFLSVTNVLEDFSIVKLQLEKDYCLVDHNGKIIKKLHKEDFVDLKGNHFLPVYIDNVFKNSNEYYLYFNSYKNVFRFDKKEQKFKEIPKTSKGNQIIKALDFKNDFKRGIKTELISDYTKLSIYHFKDKQDNLIADIKIKNFSKYSYNEVDENLVVLNGNTLDLYYITDSNIKTFLKEKSVRAINKLNNNKYIVATDAEGFYEINVDRNTEDKIAILDGGKEISINYSRDIIVQDNGAIITNDSENLFTLDSAYNIIRDKSFKIQREEIIKIGDTIFNGYRNGFMHKYSYSKKTHKNIKVDEDLLVKEFATDGNKLYATTNKGFLEYKNGKQKIYKFENEEANNLLSVTYSKFYGVLVSTKFGKVYEFNTATKKLSLIYKDDLTVSIVGMIIDNNNNLWLNTYAGIVSIDSKTKVVNRYTQKDGVYELEGNRFSMYKDGKGNIFVGSYKGLSYFNPKKLIKNNKQVKPKLTSISYFNEKAGRWKINSEPVFLENVHTITLPSLYQRFSATVSLTGNINPSDVKYRYRLIDEENRSEWFLNQFGNEILFANLAAGKYVLEIEGLNIVNEKIGETIVLNIISEIFFYKTWWFIGGLVLLVLTIIGYMIYQYITKQKLFTESKIALNDAKVKSEMMLEIHHRIKNNLQIISGLLGLQMLKSNNAELKSKLQESQGRIESIAGIHDVLYTPQRLDAISVNEHVKKIISYYKKLFSVKVDYNLTVDDSFLTMDKATPFALLLNELINNSNKHAFNNIKTPEIHIVFKKKNGGYLFEYSDNGNFKNEKNRKESLGMRIVDMMNIQLKGKMTIEESNGFKLTLRF
ncbi:histidine kinase dimerization/phosphoacceptor domain -containing protein [Polaribacter sp. L3A8]|uniref:histidine kinase dimerization/phosphoacceptor domain -containing protein n=1 Tax=Polaribacter sp. L3A8 TaxID=2686361 RepID=UPI00131B5D92|nr:histidine kinase dimerization/phosphoacceptor domain -containing protein [Polaribacter sp. L3A8]